MLRKVPRWPGVVGALILLAMPALSGAQSLTREAIEHFLLTADIIDDQPAGKGVTNSVRLTLTDGTITHDAHFQSIDVRRDRADLAGRTEIKFADSYHFNIAGYRIAKLLGLDHMVPVTVERMWQGKHGALAWWVDAKWDEEARVAARTRPTDVPTWSRQLNLMALFSQLIYDTDRNQGNILYTEDWDLWLIDFTRAFRPWSDLRDAASLGQCERALFERLQTLTLGEVREAVGDHLTQVEALALMDRRNRMVEHFHNLIAEKGEQRVLYGAADADTRSSASSRAEDDELLRQLLAAAAAQTLVAMPSSEMGWLGTVVTLATYRGSHELIAQAGVQSGHAMGLLTDNDRLLWLAPLDREATRCEALSTMAGDRVEIYGSFTSQRDTTVVHVTACRQAR